MFVCILLAVFFFVTSLSLAQTTCTNEVAPAKGIIHQFRGEDGVDNWPGPLNMITPEKPYTRETITAPARLVPYGPASMKTEIKPGDPQWSGDTTSGSPKRRAEYSWSKWRFDLGKEGWAGGAFYLPSDPMGKNRGTDIFQLHYYPDTSEIMHFTTWDGKLRITSGVYGGTIYETNLAPLLDQWNTMVLNFKPSKGSDGFFKVWINDNLVVNETGSSKSVGSLGPYLKHGAYFWGYEKFDKVKRALVYHDNIRIGDETSDYDSVDPKCWQ